MVKPCLKLGLKASKAVRRIRELERNETSVFKSDDLSLKINPTNRRRTVGNCAALKWNIKTKT